MEMACFFKRMSGKAVFESVPRDTSKEADSLANCRTEQFDPNLRVHIGPTQLHRDIFSHALAVGREAEQASWSAKRGGAHPDKARPQKLRKSEQKLRVTDPGKKVQHSETTFPRPVGPTARRDPGTEMKDWPPEKALHLVVFGG